MKISRLPRLISPNRTVPSISEIVAGSLGRRASNSSATRGRPPVMSRVLYASRDTLARTSPAYTSWPSSTVSCAPSGMTKSRSRFSFSPFFWMISMCGCSFLSRSSMITRWRRPVSSSSSSRTKKVQLLVPVLDDHALAPARELVELFPDGFLLDDVDEAHHPCHVGHDRVGVRVPREQHAVPPHLLAVLDHHRGAERHVEARVHRELALLAGAVLRRPQNQLALVARDHALLVGCLDEGQAVAVLDDAFHLGLAHRLLG